MSTPYPPALLIQGRRLPGTAEATRRLCRAADLQPGERVLVVGAGEGESLRVLARDFGAHVTALEWEAPLVAALEARVRDEGLTGRVQVKQGDIDALPRGNFEVVLLETLPPPGAVGAYVGKLRELLALNGRLALTLPAAVGVSSAAPVASFWAQELGFALARPGQLLGALEQSGYEPQWAEALSEEVLSEYYRQLEGRLGDTADAALAERQRQAIDLYRNQGGRRCLSYAMLVARRREPGEKPPPARTQG